MGQREISVVAYSGYRGEECPRSFILDGETIDVTEILRMWVEEGVEDRTRIRFFNVSGSDGHTHILFHDEKLMQWLLR
jgi:hypothetical protein